jgi:hypothetical protein
MRLASRRWLWSAAKLVLAMLVVGSAGTAVVHYSTHSANPRSALAKKLDFQARKPMDTGGFTALLPRLKRWPPAASLEEVSNSFRGAAAANIAQIDQILAHPELPDERRIVYLMMKAALYNYDAQPAKALEVLARTRSWLEGRDAVAAQWLYSVIYFQGVTALRRGENDNCIACRGESSCIFPIESAALHTNPYGSRLAITHFSEYLGQFPEDVGVRWLLNLAHMTLGQYPDRIEPRFLIAFDRLDQAQFGIGRFRDIGHEAGVDRFNQAGGAIMDDFDDDGFLDLAVTSLDPTMPMAFYRNRGDGTFEDQSDRAGVTGQLGGLVCYQTDYNNDGRLDIFIPRGAWFPYPIRPSLLRNDGECRFSDVTENAGLLDPVNSNAAAWADFDNDGWLDLFVACEKQPNRLYHNKGNGTFEEVAARAGVDGKDQEFYKGCAWIDFDNDRFCDLFLNCMSGLARLYRNNHDGTFSNVSGDLGIDGPRGGFSCWAWDYDNDGWQDIFATSYDRSLSDIVRGFLGQTHTRCSNRLFRNVQGKRFEDGTAAAGLDMVFAAMGSNFGDFDNDGFLDMYLGTGDTDPGTLVPNRMFRNVAGQRFAEITVSSGTGHLQKGHAVSCADWDNDGDLDILIEMGGAIDGDKYHNILFQNPGQNNNWLKIKLVGKKTNRAAIGARIKIVTDGEKPLLIYRHISSGSSFGANPLEQTIGLAKSRRVALLQVDWPSSGTTQVFRDIPANLRVEITEFERDYRTLPYKQLPASLPDRRFEARR